MAASKSLDPYCSIARSLGVIGERWSFLILREALSGVTRFADFRSALGVASDVLTERLNTLVEFGVLDRVQYQEPGKRARFSYHVTDAGRQLTIALGALQQWGDEFLPREGGPTVERRVRDTDEAAHVGFVDRHGREVALADVTMIRTDQYPTRVLPS